MVGKFMVFCLLALCTMQVQTRSVEPRNDNRDLDDIIKVIQDLINKIHQIIGEITSNLPEFVKGLEEKIKEIISGIHIDDIIEKIKQNIENILGNLGETAKKCVEAEREAIENLAQENQAGAQACIEVAENKLTALRQEVDDLLEKGNAVRNDIIERTKKCIRDNALNPANTIACLKSQIKPMQNELHEIEVEVKRLIEEAKELGVEASQELSTCMNRLATETSTKEQVIVEDIKKCIVGN